MTPTRSATASASSWSWVTNRVVVPTSSLDAADLVAQLDPDLGVERGQRLVEQQHRRLDRQRPGEGHPLLLAAGQLVRRTGRPGSSRPTSSSISAAASTALRRGVRLRSRSPNSTFCRAVRCGNRRVRLEDHAHVAPVGRHAGDVPAADRRRGRVGVLEAGEAPQRGRLAAAGRPEQRHELAGREVQGQPVEGVDPAVAAAQVGQLDGRAAAPVRTSWRQGSPGRFRRGGRPRRASDRPTNDRTNRSDEGEHERDQRRRRSRSARRLAEQVRSPPAGSCG